MYGEWYNDTQTLAFEPLSNDNAWIRNECDYAVVGLRGHLEENGLHFTGEITRHSECTTFSLIKGGASSSACFDSDNGATDSLGGACGDYSGNVHKCGMQDDPDFNATSLCCACGGGVRGGMATSACFNWNSSATDDDGNTCSWYMTNPGECGLHDRPGFKAAHLCCKCGGGVQAIGTSWRQELHELQDEREEIWVLQRSLDRLTAEVGTLKSSEETAGSKMELLRQQSQELRDRSAALQAERQSLLLQITSAEREASNLKGVSSNLRDRYDNLESAYESACLLVKVAGCITLAVVVAAVALTCGRVSRLDRNCEARNVGDAILDARHDHQPTSVSGQAQLVFSAPAAVDDCEDLEEVSTKLL